MTMKTIASVKQLAHGDRILLDTEIWKVLWPAEFASHESTQFLAMREDGTKRVFSMRNTQTVIILK